MRSIKKSQLVDEVERNTKRNSGQVGQMSWCEVKEGVKQRKRFWQITYSNAGSRTRLPTLYSVHINPII
jgi:hypothetical protein